MGKYKFLWRGKDKSGAVRVEKVSADTAQQAKEQLTEAGWSELELIMDELVTSEALDNEFEGADGCGDDEPEELNTPEEEAKFFEGKGPGLLRQTWWGIKESWLTITLFAAVFGLGYFLHMIWLMVISAIVITFWVLLTPVLHVVLRTFGNSKNYNRLNRAKVWGRWDEVLECVEALEKPHWLAGGKIAELELVKCRAQAYAATGRLDEGVKIYSQLEKNPKIERWMYLYMLATVYDAGKSHEQALNLRRQASIERPDNSSVRIDLAYSCVRHLNRPAEAREYLAQAEAMEIPGMAKDYLPFLRGMIFWRERKMTEAIEQLEMAKVSLKAWASNPLVEGIILLSMSHLCACHRAQGNRAKADKLFRQTEAFLRANKEDELIAACKGR